ncbi:MAG: DnaJ family domain-containing protein [Syntrophobacteria bacterium]
MSRGDVFTVMERVAEERIREAQLRGDFEDLPGKGEPLALEDDRHIPEDLRLAYKILKNADCLPPELELKREIHTTEQLLGGITDEEEKYRQLKRLNFLVMKLNMIRKVPIQWEEHQRYYEKIVERVGKGKRC